MERKAVAFRMFFWYFIQSGLKICRMCPKCGSVKRFYWHFFYFMNQTHLGPWKQVKMVLLKNSFSRIYSRNTVGDSAQANTAMREKTKFFIIQNWLTMPGVRLCTVLASTESNNFVLLSNISISREFRIHLLIFLKNVENFRKSKID